MHQAAFRGYERAVNLLLEKGADTAVQDRDGETALQGSERLFACPEQRGDAPTAYHVWHISFHTSEQATCVETNIKAEIVSNVDNQDPPCGYSGCGNEIVIQMDTSMHNDLSSQAGCLDGHNAALYSEQI